MNAEQKNIIKNIGQIFVAILILLPLLFDGVCAKEWEESENEIRVCYDSGKYEEALDCTEAALINIEANEGAEHQHYAVALNYLAMIQQGLANYGQAEEAYLKSVALIKKIYGQDQLVYAGLAQNLALLYLNDLNQPDKAAPLLRDAVRIYRQYVSPKYADALFNLANLDYGAGRYPEAEFKFKNVLRFYQVNNMTSGHDYMNTVYQLAGLYTLIRQYDKAEPLITELCARKKPADDELNLDYTHALNNKAKIFNYIGRYEESEKMYITVLDAYEELFGAKHRFYTRALNDFARLYDNMGKYDEAEDLWLRSLNKYKRQIRMIFPSLSEEEKGRFYTTISPNIEDFYSFAVRRAEKTPSIISEMYDTRLVTKAILLNATTKVKRRILNSGDKKLISMYNSWISLKETLSKLYTFSVAELKKKRISISKLEKKAIAIERVLSLKSELFARAYTKGKVNWKKIRNVLNEGEAAVEIIRMRYKEKNLDSAVYYAALIITRESEDHPDLLLLKNGNMLEDGSYRCYNNMIRFQLLDQDSYDQFWKPFEKKLVGINKVYISLDGVYNQINLSTLEKSPRHFLIDDIDLHIVNNTKDILEFGTRSKSGISDHAELIGAPDYNHSNMTEREKRLEAEKNKLYAELGLDEVKTRELTRYKVADLPGAEIEVNSLSEIFKENHWKTNLTVGKSASKDVLKKITNPKVLHIATHGYFYSDIDACNDTPVFGIDNKQAFKNPLLRSGLLFAGANNTLNKQGSGNSDNGILTAYEAMNLDLDNTDLVVLSACETGLGKVQNGEGVYGLQRSFRVAGAHTIIMSLWKVNDFATQELMSIFYDQWLATGDKHLAFKEAQLTLKERYNRPYFWGAFVIVGE